jgi:hypothetical protein
MGCSHGDKVHHSGRLPASVKDVGVVGPDGEVLLYYREGDFIVVKACERYSILGMTSSDAHKNCKGRSNKVPVSLFKESLRNLVLKNGKYLVPSLKPLSIAEAEALCKEGLNSEQAEALALELERINKFISVYGKENAPLWRKEQIIQSLQSYETFQSATKKMNDEIENALNLITDDTKLTLTKFSSDQDQFLYSVLKEFNPNQKFPCGLKGSVEERIKDCSYQLTSEKDGFVLVTRSKDFREVYKEVSTGLIWSDTLPKMMKYSTARNACNSSLQEVAGVSGLTWRLPSIDEFKEAEKNGIRKLPYMNPVRYWSSSVHPDNSRAGWQFNGYYGITVVDSHDSFAAVRCVAR